MMKVSSSRVADDEGVRRVREALRDAENKTEQGIFSGLHGGRTVALKDGNHRAHLHDALRALGGRAALHAVPHLRAAVLRGWGGGRQVRL